MKTKLTRAFGAAVVVAGIVAACDSPTASSSRVADAHAPSLSGSSGGGGGGGGGSGGGGGGTSSAPCGDLTLTLTAYTSAPWIEGQVGWVVQTGTTSKACDDIPTTYITFEDVTLPADNCGLTSIPSVYWRAPTGKYPSISKYGGTLHFEIWTGDGCLYRTRTYLARLIDSATGWVLSTTLTEFNPAAASAAAISTTS
jgi:hypothetical protein